MIWVSAVAARAAFIVAACDRVGARGLLYLSATLSNSRPAGLRFRPRE